MKTSDTERRAKCDAKKREQGFVRVSVWVPAEAKDELLKIAREMQLGIDNK